MKKNNTNYYNNLILFGSVTITILYLLIFWNSIEYHAAGENISELSSIDSGMLTYPLFRDMLIPNNSQVIGRKLSMDQFGEEWLISNRYEVTANEKYLGNPRRNFLNFFHLHEDIPSKRGYTLVPVDKPLVSFDLTSDNNAEEQAILEANLYFPDGEGGILNLIKSNCNLFFEKLGIKNFFHTVEIAKSEYIAFRTEEILKIQEEKFLEALETNQQCLQNIRKYLNGQGMDFFLTAEKKITYCEEFKNRFTDTITSANKIYYDDNAYDINAFLVVDPKLSYEIANRWLFQNNFKELDRNTEEPYYGLDLDKFHQVIIIEELLCTSMEQIHAEREECTPDLLFKTMRSCNQASAAATAIFHFQRLFDNLEMDESQCRIFFQNLSDLGRSGVLLNSPEIFIKMYEDINIGYSEDVIRTFASNPFKPDKLLENTELSKNTDFSEFLKHLENTSSKLEKEDLNGIDTYFEKTASVSAV